MERVILVACPALFVEDDGGGVLRTFARVIEVVGAYCPWVIPVRPGVCSLPARGPARFFGGEHAVVDLLGQAVAGVERIAPVQVGVADGLFAARLAAEAGLVVPPGGSPAFLRPWPVTILERPDLADLLCRLGITTLGDFAGLPEPHVMARLGTDGMHCHRVARGLDGELPGYRHPDIARRLARLDRPVPSPVRQRGFWGGTDRVAAGAVQALGALQTLVGVEGVQMIRRQDGRTPLDQARLVTWLPDPAVAKDPPPAPWPGRLPSPAPALVHRQARGLQLLGAGHQPVVVTGRGELSDIPEHLSVEGGPWLTISGWAGPWLSVERWWRSSRRRAAWLQVVLDTGAAYLLRSDRGEWRFAATYD